MSLQVQFYLSPDNLFYRRQRCNGRGDPIGVVYGSECDADGTRARRLGSGFDGRGDNVPGQHGRDRPAEDYSNRGECESGDHQPENVASKPHRNSREVELVLVRIIYILHDRLPGVGNAGFPMRFRGQFMRRRLYPSASLGMKKSSQLGRIGWKQAVLAIPPCIAAVANFSGTRESGLGDGRG